MARRAAAPVAFTDPVLLNRIVSNLLANAVRYGVRGGGSGILLALRTRGQHLAIEVWDTGIGIATHERASIFREFYQVGNLERDRSKGLGLGLAIVDRLVRLLNLTLEGQSQPGRGSLFRVLVPLGDPDSSTLPPLDGTAAQATPPPTPLSGRFVLVIDDEPAVCDATAALLTGWGCRVLTAGSPAEMKTALTGERRVSDLILCNYRLRGNENGIAVIEDLRAEYNDDIPGLIVTGDTMPARLAGHAQAAQPGQTARHARAPLDTAQQQLCHGLEPAACVACYRWRVDLGGRKIRRCRGRFRVYLPHGAGLERHQKHGVVSGAQRLNPLRRI